MNKQKLLHELNRLLPKQGTESSYLSGGRAGIELAITLVEELEEPEKVVIPQFVADWIEDRKEKSYNMIYNMHVLYFYKTHQDVCNWVTKSAERTEMFLEAILNGYEVEQEAKYLVRLSEITESDSYVNLDTRDGKYFLGSKSDMFTYQTKFTQDEVDGLPWELNDDWNVIPVEVAE